MCLGFSLVGSKTVAGTRNTDGQLLDMGLGQEVFKLNEGFAYGTASTTPVRFSVAWESRCWPGGDVPFVIQSWKLSCDILWFIPANSIQIANSRKIDRLVSSLITQSKPTQCLSTE